MAAFVDREGVSEVGYRGGRQCHEDALAKLYEDAVGLFGVEEEDELAIGTGLGLVGERGKAEAAQALQVGVDVIDLKGQVVEARAALGEVPGHRRVGAEGFEEFEFGASSG